MHFKLWMESDQSAYRTTPELVEKQIKQWEQSAPFARFPYGLQTLRVDEIQPNLGDFYETHVEEIKAAIEADTELPPIVVKKKGPMDKKYMIKDGTHRHLASMRAGKTHIPVLVQH